MSLPSNVNDNKTLPKNAGRPIPDSPQSLAAAAPAKLPGSPSSDSINSGFSVGSQVAVGATKPTDCKTITGSTPGDHRMPAKDGVTAALDAIKNAGGPRNAVGQFRNSVNDHGAPFQSTVDPTQVGE